MAALRLVCAVAFVAVVAGLGGCAAHRRPPAAPSDATPLAVATPDASPALTTSTPGCPTATAAADEPDADDATVDDGFEAPAAPPGAAGAPVPFAALGDAELAARLRTDIGALGPTASAANLDRPRTLQLVRTRRTSMRASTAPSRRSWAGGRTARCLRVISSARRRSPSRIRRSRERR